MKPLKEKISITIDNDILEILKVKAENDDRSLSQYINKILKSYLKDCNAYTTLDKET
ncbi:MAG: toxin-antitoxin system protein [Clostridia bacterium]|nr:toxin-antitoxin system protein [Clostridia bacterium]